MRVRLEKDGTAFEFERKPMPERRFRALCLLGALWLYGGMMVGVAALCGMAGVWALVILTAVVAAFDYI